MKIFSALLTGAAMVAATLPAAAMAQDTAGASAFQMKRCVNMGNALEAPSHEPWGRHYTQADYQRIAAAGFDTVRIPVRWNDYLGPLPDFAIHPAMFEMVEQQLEWADAAGLKIILNVHHFDELMENPQQQMPRFRAIWHQLAARYAALPDTVWFEVLNEPHKNLSGPIMRTMQAEALAIIRQYDADRIVILGGDDYSGIRTLGSNIFTDDPNTVYTFHYYDPFTFTHQGASWLGDGMPKGERGWGSAEDRAELAAAVTTATTFRDAVKRPIFLGEFGVNAPVKAADRVRYNDAVAKAMEDAGIGWCLWSYANTFALYTDEGGWDADMLAALTDDK